MKHALTTFVVATTLVAGTAFGATAPKKVVKKKQATATTASMKSKKATNADLIKTSAAAPSDIDASAAISGGGGGTSTASVINSSNTSIMSKFSLAVSLDYYGAAINDIGSSYNPNADTGKPNLKSRVNMENGVLLGYKLDAKQSLTAGVFAAQVPYGELSSSMLDLQFRYTHGSIYHNGGFNLGTQVRYYAPTSTTSSSNGSLGNIRWYQFASYEIAKSRFSVELTTYLRPYAYSDNALAASKNATRLDLYMGPAVNYQISPKVKAWLLFEQLGRSKMKNGTFEMASLGDLEPGMTLDISKRVSFSPYLDIKTHNKVSISTTTINANLTIKAL